MPRQEQESPEERLRYSAPDAVRRVTGVYTREVGLCVFTDQVDSVRALTLPDGQPVKCVEYDSFGNVTADTRPEWRFALGFACGLNDPFTGFIRFGFRDYDPFFGRFTAKDPARDMRGDGDLYDYCVDDPVGRFDPTGLRGESAEKEYGLFRRTFGWWTLPHDDPEFQRRDASLKRSMKKSLGELGTGIIYLDELTPSLHGLGLNSLPGYKRERVYEKKRY